MRARNDPPAKPIKSEQIKLESVADYITTTPIAKAIAAKEKAEHIERVAAIVDSGDFSVAPFGGLPTNRAQILWRENGSMIAPGGIKYY